MGKIPKKFSDLFELKKNQLIAKVNLTIFGEKYEKDQIIKETKFDEFDLLEEPENHDYIVERLNVGFNLIGKIPLIK